ncbi:Zn-dependent hydrolase, partial [Candidatus Saccharibacteria bacterium]|nr:Zn-dependent hydrolase [Candidatus Saccharibacteria bacterium]
RFALTSPEALLNIEGPGEYGVAQFDIRGVAAQRHLDSEKDPLASTMYRIEAGDIRLAVVGNIYEKVSEQQLEELGVVDVLILPVGGNGYTLDATGAASLVRQVDPKVVVPVHYADDALTYEVPQEPLELFVKELGAPVEEVAKMKLKSAAQLPATLTVYALVRS